jgi:uncharacterized membrane protein
MIEVFVCSIEAKKFVSRGFLIGPYCPIYGYSAIIMIFFLQRYESDILVLFVMGTIIASIAEYVTSYLMEKLFNARWWDYSHIPFNLNGRICLKNSMLFGLLAVILIYVVNPFITSTLNQIPKNILMYISLLILIIFVIDNTLTFNIMFQIKSKVKVIKKDYTEEMTKKVRAMLAEHSFISRRILTSFPNITFKGKGIQKNKVIKLFKNNK